MFGTILGFNSDNYAVQKYYVIFIAIERDLYIIYMSFITQIFVRSCRMDWNALEQRYLSGFSTEFRNPCASLKKGNS